MGLKSSKERNVTTAVLVVKRKYDKDHFKKRFESAIHDTLDGMGVSPKKRKIQILTTRPETMPANAIQFKLNSSLLPCLRI